LYKVEFGTPLGSGTGVVVIEGGKLRGGDSSMYYVGSFAISGDQISASVATNRHTSVPGVQPVFGRDRGQHHVERNRQRRHCAADRTRYRSTGHRLSGEADENRGLG